VNEAQTTPVPMLSGCSSVDPFAAGRSGGVPIDHLSASAPAPIARPVSVSSQRMRGPPSSRMLEALPAARTE
jgi:hypothetical protein